MHSWKSVLLGDIATVSSGNSAPQDKSLFSNGTYPFIRTSDVGQVRFGTIAASRDYLNSQGVNKLRRFEKGTILFPKSGASTFLNHRVIMDIDGYVASHLATINANNNQAEPRFLLYFLSTVRAQDLIQDHKYPSLNLPVIKSIPVPLPPLTEQQRIVGILDKAFAGIATAKDNAEKNLQNASALFESHLQSVFTQRDKGWVEKLLSSFAHSISTGPFGSLLHKSDYVRDGVPLVNPVNIVRGKIVPDGNKLIDKATKQRLESYVLKDGDVVIGRRGEIGRCAVVEADQDGWVCGTGCFFIRPLPSVNSQFLANLIRSSSYRERLERLATGTTMLNLSNKALGDLPVALPCLLEQEKILGKLDDLREETQRLESIYQQKLSAMKALRISLLHQAFTEEL